MNIRFALLKDLETLMKVRFDFLSNFKEVLAPDEKQAISSQLRAYFRKHINRDFFAVLAEKEGEVVSAAFLIIYEKPANPWFKTGKTAALLNVLTYPEYRKKGYAAKAIKLLIEKAKQMNVSYIDLSASEVGKPLYEDLGFTEIHSTEMRLRLI